jgi:hypothetical protein
MRKSNDCEELLRDVLAEDELRQATLQRALVEMGRVRRRRRSYRRAVVCIPLIGLILISTGRNLLEEKKPIPAEPRTARAEQKVPGTSIRIIDDEQLLELFSGRPVALVGPPGHQQLVLFDEVIN